MRCISCVLLASVMSCTGAFAQVRGVSIDATATAHREKGHSLYAGSSILDAKDEFLTALRLDDSLAGQVDALRMIGQISLETKDFKSAQWAYSKALALLRGESAGQQMPLQYVMCSQGLASTLDGLGFAEDAMLERELLVREIDDGHVWAEHVVVWGAAVQAARHRVAREELSEAEVMYDRAVAAGAAMRDGGLAMCVALSEASQIAAIPTSSFDQALADPLVARSPYRTVILSRAVAAHLEAGNRARAMELVDTHMSNECLLVSAAAVRQVAADLSRQQACLLRQTGRDEEALIWIDMACSATTDEVRLKACKALRDEIEDEIAAQAAPQSP